MLLGDGANELGSSISPLHENLVCSPAAKAALIAVNIANAATVTFRVIAVLRTIAPSRIMLHRENEIASGVIADDTHKWAKVGEVLGFPSTRKPSPNRTLARRRRRRGVLGKRRNAIQSRQNAGLSDGRANGLNNAG
jgi:hypothetical protein